MLHLSLLTLRIRAAINDILFREDLGHCVIAQQAKSSFQHAHRGEGITRAAATLVAHRSQVVAPVYVAPIEAVGEGADASAQRFRDRGWVRGAERGRWPIGNECKNERLGQREEQDFSDCINPELPFI